MGDKSDSPSSEENKGKLRISRTTLPDAKSSKSDSRSNKEDHFLKVLHQQSREISLVINLEGQIKYCNQAIKTLLGYEASRMIGNNFKEIIPVQQWVAFRAALRASEEESNEPIIIDCNFIDAENVRKSFSVSVVDQRHHPLVEGYIIHAHMNNRVRMLEHKLSLRDIAIDSIQDGLIIVDPRKKKIVFANRHFYELSGFNKSDVLGGKLDLFKSPYSEMLFDEQTDAKEVERFVKSIKSGKNYKGRIYSKRKNGEVFYNLFTLRAVFDHSQKLQYYVATAKEIKPRGNRY